MFYAGTSTSIYNLSYIKRTFDKPCGGVESYIINQLSAWHGDGCPYLESTCQERLLPSNCTACTAMPCGQRCLYEVSHYEI